MQTSLCLQTTGPSARIPHSRLALCQAGSVFLQCPGQITLNFSPFFCTGLRARPSRRPFSLAIRAHMTPPEDDIDKKKDEEARRGTVKLVAAAVVLIACTLGAMYTNRKARADEYSLFKSFSTQPPATGDGSHSTPPSIPGDAPPSIPGDAPHGATVKEDSIQTKSKRALQKVLEQKFAPGTQKPARAVPEILIDLLREAIPPIGTSKWEPYISQLRRGYKPDTIIETMYSELMNTQNISEEEYNVGLVLIDLLIHQGDYKRANDVCKKVEPAAPPYDLRVKIRWDVLKMLLEGEGIEKEWKKIQSKLQKFTDEELKKN